MQLLLFRLTELQFGNSASSILFFFLLAYETSGYIGNVFPCVPVSTNLNRRFWIFRLLDSVMLIQKLHICWKQEENLDISVKPSNTSNWLSGMFYTTSIWTFFLFFINSESCIWFAEVSWWWLEMLVFFLHVTMKTKLGPFFINWDKKHTMIAFILPRLPGYNKVWWWRNIFAHPGELKESNCDN